MVDKINKGLPSDRIEVHWHINSPHVADNVNPRLEDAVALSTHTINEAGFPVYKKLQEPDLTAEAYSFTVPKDFQLLKMEDKELTLDWRWKSRKQFQKLFRVGYTAIRTEVDSSITSTYYFVKKASLDLGGEAI